MLSARVGPARDVHTIGSGENSAVYNTVQAALQKVGSAKSLVLQKVGSAKSLLTADTTAAHSSCAEESIFDQNLPQDTEALTIDLPRGMRFALGQSLAGEVTDPLVRSHRTYYVTVEPNGRQLSARERFKPRLDPIAAEHPANAPTSMRFHDAAMDAVIEERHGRADFRKQRLTAFNLKKNVPALCCSRLVPSWREIGGGGAVEAKKKLDAAMEFMQDRKEKDESKSRAKKQKARFVTPTLSMANKRTNKVELDSERWSASGGSAAKELLTGEQRRYIPGDLGGMALCDAKVHERRVHEKEGKQKRMKPDETLALPLFAGEREYKIKTEIAELRTKASEELKSLSDDYASERTNYTAKNRNYCTPSSFQQYEREENIKDRIAAELRIKQEQKKSKENPRMVRSSLANLMSIGLGRPPKKEDSEIAPTSPATTKGDFPRQSSLMSTSEAVPMSPK